MHSLHKVLDSLQIPFDTLGRVVDVRFEGVTALDDATHSSLLFVHRPTEQTPSLLLYLNVAGVLVPTEWARQERERLLALPSPVVGVANPRWTAARVQASVRLEDDQWGTGIHPSALVSPQAQLAEDVTVGPYCVLGSCRVGAGSRIGAFCRIHDGVTLGRQVKIREHASLGGVGFGAERGPDGILARFPHHGSVIVEDGVEIFPYANVDRGTFGPTRVGEGTFVDHYVHIGHNSSVGRYCIITAQVVLCGKSVIEDRVWLGVGSIIREGRRVGADATVGLGTVVIKDVPAGATVAGVPARHIRSEPTSS